MVFNKIKISFNKSALIAISLLSILNSCTKIDKNIEQNKKETKIAPEKLSNRFKNKLSNKDLKEYVLKTEEIKFDDKFDKPFNVIDFDKVIAYDYEGQEEGFNSAIDNYGKFIPIIEKQVALNKKQIINLINNILTSNSTYGGTTAACFRPHLSFVFYYKNECVFKTDICLGCNFLDSSKLIPATEYHKFKFENGEEYPAIGFSKKGKKRIIQLSKELGLFYGNHKL